MRDAATMPLRAAPILDFILITRASTPADPAAAFL